MPATSPSEEVPRRDFRQALARFFGPGGALQEALPTYEERAEQREMALAIAEAIDAGTTLVAEAGTGTGKTLAYLVPALASGLKVVVSTGTKNLQEQLLGKDLPLVERAAGRRFDVVVLKGRSNYLCEARYERAAAQGRLFSGPDTEVLAAVGAWRNETQTGDRAELTVLRDDAAIWGDLTVTSEQCTGRRCSEYERCWVTRVRRRAQECNLLIVNHHLFFADAALRARLGENGASILPPFDLVIFDEAHELEEIAAQHFGYQVSERRFTELCRDVDQATAEHPDRTGLLRTLMELDLQSRALFDTLPFAPGRTRLRRHDLGERVHSHYQAVDEALRRLEAHLFELDGDDALPLRRRTVQLGAELAFVLRRAPRSSTLAEAELDTDPADHDHQDDQDDEGAGGDGFDGEGPERVPFVRYAEGSSRNRAVVARPLDIAPSMRATLGPVPSIFTSATLAVGRDFTHFERRIGLQSPAELLVDSPFDFTRQACLYLPVDLPDVSDPSFGPEAAARAAELIRASRGGAFVLCTSNRMLALMAAALRAQTPLTILTQGSAPRSHLIARFIELGEREERGERDELSQRDVGAVLIATMSFWRGVDVPGNALRQVIIDRLPFASPGDPIVEARLEHLRRIGRSPFNAYQLPQATLLLRQGFGRLIRSRADRGVVSILDRRIVTRSYGRVFLDSLPACSRLEDVEAVRNFFGA